MPLFLIHGTQSTSRQANGIEGAVIQAADATVARAAAAALQPQFANAEAFAVVQLTASADFAASGLALVGGSNLFLIEGRALTAGKLTRGGDPVKL